MDITIYPLEHGTTFREFWHKTFTDPAIFWVFLTAIATIALVLVGYFQLADLVRTRKTELLQRLQEDFFDNPEAEALLRLIADNRLRFRNTSVFDVVLEEKETIDGIEIEIDVSMERVLASELVRLLLNPLEYLGFLERRKIIILNEVALKFTRAILICWRNEEIKKYIYAMRKEYKRETLYEDFEYLAQKILHRRKN